MERDLGLSTHVRSVTTGSWRINWHSTGATVNAKCGIIGRSVEIATLPKTGPNRPEGSRFVATRVLGEATELGVGPDITKFPTGEGKLYLFVIKDLYDGTVVSWKTHARSTSELVVSTVKWAVEKSAPERKADDSSF